MVIILGLGYCVKLLQHLSLSWFFVRKFCVSYSLIRFCTISARILESFEEYLTKRSILYSKSKNIVKYSQYFCINRINTRWKKT